GAPAVGGVPEQRAGCGVVVEPRNPRQLAAAILGLIEDPERRAELGRAARENAVRRFGMAQFARDHGDTYRRLSKRHRSLAAEVDPNLAVWYPRRARQDGPAGPVNSVAVARVAREVERVGGSPA